MACGIVYELQQGAFGRSFVEPVIWRIFVGALGSITFLLSFGKLSWPFSSLILLFFQRNEPLSSSAQVSLPHSFGLF